MPPIKPVGKPVDVAAAAQNLEAAVAESLETGLEDLETGLEDLETKMDTGADEDGPVGEVEELGDIYVSLAKPDILLWDASTGIKFSGNRIVATPLNKFVSEHMLSGKLRQATKEEYSAYLQEQKG